MPLVALSTTGKNADRAALAIFNSMPKPKIRNRIGRKMIFGVPPIAMI